MAYTFKLSDPGQQPGKGVCQVPTWLEEHLSHVSSNFDPQILGKVDISLIHSKPFNYSEHSDGNYYNHQNVASTHPTPSIQPKQELIRSIPESPVVSSNGNHNVSTTPVQYEKPVNPKTFCDNLYMRIVSVLYYIQDEEQTAQIQNKLEGVVCNLEKTFLR